MRRTPRLIAAPALLVALVLAFAGLIPGAGDASPASAATAGPWNAGGIISDDNFYDSTALSAAEIQAFLATKGANCTQPADTAKTTYAPCLKDLVLTTTNIASSSACAGYRGATETGAEVIAKVAAACAINPEVLLVILQKEQTLVTRSTVTASAYAAATGANCPDTSACNAAYAGFAQQVYRTGQLFQIYKARASSYTYQAGSTVAVRYSPTASCGSSAVTIANQATAALYIYTPYQPNAAALAAGWGTGDSCSSYGNRNFWLLYWSWFGDPYGAATHAAPAAAAVPDGALVVVSGRYYLVSGRSKVAFPSKAAVTNAGLKTASATEIGSDVAAGYSTVRSTMLAVRCGAKKYYLANKRLLRIDKVAQKGRFPWTFTSLSKAACASLALSKTSVGKFITAPGGKRYIVIKKKKYAVASAALYRTLRGKSAPAVSVSAYFASGITTGKAITGLKQARKLGA